jgi:hypothetical protein
MFDDVDTIYDFFAECPDIAAPKSMKDLPRYSQALLEAGHTTWAETFMEWYHRFCEVIVNEVTPVKEEVVDA